MRRCTLYKYITSFASDKWLGLMKLVCHRCGVISSNCTYIWYIRDMCVYKKSKRYNINISTKHCVFRYFNTYIHTLQISIMHVHVVLFGSCILCIYLHICLGVFQLVGRLGQAAVSIIWNLVREPGFPEPKFGPQRLFRVFVGDEILASFILGILIKPNVWYIYLHWSHQNVDMSHALSVWVMLIQQKIQNLGMLL